MLTQSFKSAADLGLSEKNREALMKVLVLMETGKMTYVPFRDTRPWDLRSRYDGYFNMAFSLASSDCGTTNCIRGAAIAVGGAHFDDHTGSQGGLHDLFYRWLGDPNVEQGATALRNFLTYGEPKWKEVMNMEDDNG